MVKDTEAYNRHSEYSELSKTDRRMTK